MGHRLGIDKIDEYASLFGLGEYTGIELPEVKGYVAGPATSEALGVEWYGGNLLNAAIGQDNTQVTPLQLANYIVTLLNGGDHFVPHLLKSVKSSDYSETVYEQQPEVKNHIALDPANVEAVKRGMWEVANDPKSTVDQYLSTWRWRWAPRPAPPGGSADKEPTPSSPCSPLMTTRRSSSPSWWRAVPRAEIWPRPPARLSTTIQRGAYGGIGGRREHPAPLKGAVPCV